MPETHQIYATGEKAGFGHSQEDAGDDKPGVAGHGGRAHCHDSPRREDPCEEQAWAKVLQYDVAGELEDDICIKIDLGWSVSSCAQATFRLFLTGDEK